MKLNASTPEAHTPEAHTPVDMVTGTHRTGCQTRPVSSAHQYKPHDGPVRESRSCGGAAQDLVAF